MRWERLFADLEAEAAEIEARDRDAEIAERTRAGSRRCAGWSGSGVRPAGP